MKHIKAPDPHKRASTTFNIFLAGSIEQGKAEKWQDRVANSFSGHGDHIQILNPRRDDWDETWENAASNPKFREQVEWELNSLRQSDLIAMYFDPSTKSPITLLELGLFCRDNEVIVCCPDGFWRQGNVEIVCGQNRTRFFTDPEEWEKYLIRRAGQKMASFGLVLKTGGEWVEHFGDNIPRIIDEDGWDRSGKGVTWNTPITKDEFLSRMCGSTVIGDITKLLKGEL